MKFKNLTLSPNSYVPNCQAPKLHESNNLKMVKTKLIKLNYYVKSRIRFSMAFFLYLYPLVNDTLD